MGVDEEQWELNIKLEVNDIEHVHAFEYLGATNRRHELTRHRNQ